MNQEQTQYKYFTQTDLEAIANANSFSELLAVALIILERMPAKVIGLCDPLSTSRKNDNQEKFRKTIEALCKYDLPIFNEIPFEKKIVELKDKWFAENKNQTHCLPQMEEFYKPILKTGRVKTMLCFPDWDTKFTSYWLNEEAIRAKVELIYFPRDFNQADTKRIPGLGEARIQ
jgi:hypothetical protein